MLKVNGTKWKDTLKIPHHQLISSFFGSSKNLLNTIVNGKILSDGKATYNSQFHTSINQFLSRNKHKPTNNKFLPGIIRLGQDKKRIPKPKGHYGPQNSIFSPQTNLEASNKKDNNRKILKEAIHSEHNRNQQSTIDEWTHLPVHSKSIEQNIDKKCVQRTTISGTLPRF